MIKLAMPFAGLERDLDYLAEMVGTILYSFRRPIYLDYIRLYHLQNVQLSILSIACQMKLGQPVNLDDYSDPFDEFKPLKLVETDRTFTIYSYGPDRLDGKAMLFREDYWGLDSVDGYDYGYTFSKCVSRNWDSSNLPADFAILKHVVEILLIQSLVTSH